ncbi:MAG: type II toxin-antitoxin system Phd/YefM family antitoxin [Candidatus Acidiferrales bacterium]
MKKVGIRELKNHLSSCLRQVRRGARFVVTDRGKPIAYLGPPAEEPAHPKTLEDVLKELAADGHIRLAEKRGPLPDVTPIPNRGKPASRMIIEDRR